MMVVSRPLPKRRDRTEGVSAPAEFSAAAPLTYGSDAALAGLARPNGGRSVAPARVGW